MKQLSTASQQQLKRWFWTLLVINILFIAGSALYLRPLTSNNIVRFELAKHTPVAESIIQDWTDNGLLSKAKQSIYIDFLFIVLYSSALAVACIFISRLTNHEILVRAGKFFSYLMAAAGICDVIENISLLKSLYGTVSYWNVMLAYDMAATKFSLIILSVLFIGTCIIFWLLDKITTR
jgi:hypothetical protein